MNDLIPEIDFKVIRDISVQLKRIADALEKGINITSDVGRDEYQGRD
jgi:hypothetical protein